MHSRKPGFPATWVAVWRWGGIVGRGCIARFFLSQRRMEPKWDTGHDMKKSWAAAARICKGQKFPPTKPTDKALTASGLRMFCSIGSEEKVFFVVQHNRGVYAQHERLSCGLSVP